MTTTIKDITAAKLANTDRAVIDPRLTNLDIRVLCWLSSAINSETGIIRRKQGARARARRIHRRTVQRSRDRLVRLGYLKPIGKRPGGYVSAYNVPMSQKAVLAPPIETEGGP